MQKRLVVLMVSASVAMGAGSAGAEALERLNVHAPLVTKLQHRETARVALPADVHDIGLVALCEQPALLQVSALACADGASTRGGAVEGRYSHQLPCGPHVDRKSAWPVPRLEVSSACLQVQSISGDLSAELLLVPLGHEEAAAAPVVVGPRALQPSFSRPLVMSPVGNMTVSFSGEVVSQGSWNHYYFYIPAGANPPYYVSITSQTGDADLFVSRSAPLTTFSSYRGTSLRYSDQFTSVSAVDTVTLFSSDNIGTNVLLYVGVYGYGSPSNTYSIVAGYGNGPSVSSASVNSGAVALAVGVLVAAIVIPIVACAIIAGVIAWCICANRPKPTAPPQPGVVVLAAAPGAAPVGYVGAQPQVYAYSGGGAVAQPTPFMYTHPTMAPATEAPAPPAAQPKVQP